MIKLEIGPHHYCYCNMAHGSLGTIYPDPDPAASPGSAEVMGCHTVLCMVPIALTVVAWLLTVVGVATDHWLANPHANRGLFNCEFNCGLYDYDKAIQAMIIIGVILGFLAIVGVPFHPTGVVSIIGGVFIIIGIIIFVVKTGDLRNDVDLDVSLDWSFFLATTGGVLFLVAGGLAIAKVGEGTAVPPLDF